MALSIGVGAAQSDAELLDPAPEDWPTYGRNLEMWRYSPLDQISSDNVDDLRLDWSLSLGFTTDAQFSPAVYQGVMFINGADRVLALDAVTGDSIWTYQAELHPNTNSLTRDRSRGSVVVYDGKVFSALGDGRVVALDASTGEELWITQVGEIELGEGFSAGPIFADGKIILGPSGGDAGGVNGRVLAADAESGEILWSFNIVPAPGEAGFETWSPPSAAQYGGGSAWVPGAYDPESRTVIYGTGNAIPWWAGDYRGGDNLYTASYVALDVDTGELKWYHQVVPREEWDVDTIATPTIVDVTFEGEERRVALLPTVTGFLVWIDVFTGEFLQYEGYMPEYTIHTGYTADGKSIIDDSYRWTEEQAGETRTVCGFRWVDYEPAAYDPETHTYFRPNTYDCIDLAQGPPPADWQPGEGAQNIQGFSWLSDRFDRLGGLTAIDADTGAIKWEYGHGYAQRSGVLATAGNLVFMGSADRAFRAFDSATGEVLWEQRLTAYINGNPMTYAVDGRQYVAIPVGGVLSLVMHRQSGLPAPVAGSEVSLFVFALPE
jgi:alcohol dehydrogenase (cytochrome c)